MDWLTALLGVGGSLLGGIIGQQGANQASQQQQEMIQRAINLQQTNLGHAVNLIGNATTGAVGQQNAATNRALTAQQNSLRAAGSDLAPWITAGRQALTQYQGELGMGGAGFKSKFQTTPGYQFAVDQGEKGVVNNMRALGMGASGEALKALTKFRTGLADQTYQQYLDRLNGVNTQGQNSATNLAQLRTQTGANEASTIMGGAQSNSNTLTGGAGNLANVYMNGGQGIADNLVNLGTAQASGTVGGTNSWLNALGNGMNNIGHSLGSYGQGWNFLGGGATA